MAFDYRALQERAKTLQAKVEELSAKDEPSDADRDETMSLMGEIRALENTAGELRDTELEELRGIVEAGTTVGGEDPGAEERSQFYGYLLKGDGAIQNASLSTTDANGGYIVPEPVHAEMIEKVRTEDPIFGRATMFPMSGDTTLMLPYKSAHGAVANATEAGARSEQDAPTFTSPTLTCYDYYTDQRASQTFLDSVGGAETMLLNWIYEDVQEQAGADAVTGDGSTKIKGLFAETDKYSTMLSGSAGALANTNFLTAYFTLPIKYRKNAVWLMSSATLAVVAAMAYPNVADRALANQRESDGTWTVLGKPVVECDTAPAIGSTAYPVAIADIKAAYAVGVHRDTSVLRDPYTAPPKIRFYGLARLGGCAWDYQAAELIKSNNS